MNKLLTTTALLASLTFSAAAYAATPATTAPAKSARGVAAILPPAKAEIVRNAMQSSREQNAANSPALKKAYEELNTLSTAAQFDKSAFVSKEKEIQVLRNKMDDNRSVAYANALSQLTQAERKALADSAKSRRDQRQTNRKAAAPAKK